MSELLKEIAIEGLDGTGKTTVANLLWFHFTAQEIPTAICAPYKDVKAEYGSDIYPLWKSDRGAEMCIDLIKGAIQTARQKALDDKKAILIYDRHWMTAFTEIAAHPHLVERWGDEFVPTAYLRVSPETARRRAQDDPDTQAPWMQKRNYENYSTCYETLCRNYGQHLLGIYRNDDDVPLESIVRNIEWDTYIRR